MKYCFSCRVSNALKQIRKLSFPGFGDWFCCRKCYIKTYEEPGLSAFFKHSNTTMSFFHRHNWKDFPVVL